MSKKKIQIKIPEPCHKKFAEMIPAQGGSFCDSCEKIVVDFTNLTDHEIANTFIKNQGKICGQFRKDQLDRKINLTPPPVNYYRGKAASILLSGFLTAGVANAQSNTQPPLVIENQQITNQVNLGTNNKKNSTTTSNSSHTLKFLVKDHLGETLIGANILLKNSSEIGTTTDLDGTAELIIPSEFTSKDSYIIVISYTGYGTQEISFRTKQVQTTQVRLVQLMGGMVLGGPMVIVGGVRSQPQTLYGVVKNWFYKFRYNQEDRKEIRAERREDRREKRTDREAAKLAKKEISTPKKSDHKIIQLPIPQYSISLKNIFPNPFSDEINLEIYSAIKSDLQISLFNISGQKNYQVTQGVIEGKQNIQLNLKNIRLENGAYILHIKEKDGQVQSRKLIFQNNG